MTRMMEIALKRSSITVLLTLIVVIVGIISGATLPQEFLPPIQFPVVAVVTPYPLASTEVVEQSVTRPLEEALSGLPGLDRIDSTSSENVSFLLVNFKLGTDVARAEQRVTSIVNQVRPRLPDAVATPTISTFGFADLPVLIVSVGADSDVLALKQAIESKIAPVLRKVTGVGGVVVAGGGDQELLLKLDTDQMLRYGVTPTTISNALRARGLVLPVGNASADGLQVPVKVGEGISSVGDLENMVLTVYSPGSPAGFSPGAGAALPPPAATVTPPVAPQVIRLRDVGTVSLALKESAGLSRSNGKTAISIQISKGSDANTVKLARESLEALSAASATLGFPVETTVLFNQATDIEGSLSALNKDGLLGGVLAILVILIFLGNWRSALVAAFAIPISILAALAMLRFQSISLNIFSIGGLAIAVGRLVDDSIVIIEIIYRKVQEGMPIKQAVLEGPKEVASAVVISTLTSVAVFLPLGFVGGIIAEFFRPLAFAVTFALVASMIAALTLTPLLTGLLMRGMKIQKPGSAERYDLFGRLYLPTMRFALGKRWLVYVASIALFTGSIFLALQLPTNLFGSQEQSNFQVNLTMDPGTPLASTDTEVQKVEQILAAIPDVKEYNVTIGGGGGGPGGDPNAVTASSNTASFFVVTERPTATSGVIAALRAQISELDTPASIRITLASGGAPTSAKVELQVVADDQELLAQASAEIMRRITPVDLIANVSSTLTAARPEFSVKVREEEALLLGMPAVLVGSAVRDQISGQSLGTVKLDDRSLNLRLAPTGTTPDGLNQLRALPIRTAIGKTVRLDELADVAVVDGPVSVRRLNGERVALVTADVLGDDTGAATRAVNAALGDLDLPGVVWRSAGAQEAQAEAFIDLGLAILASIFLVYIFMVIGLRSLATPFILLGAIPLAAIGSFGLMYVTGTALGVPAMLGLLILIGIVVTNGIVLIDLIEQYREKGMPLMQAVLDGGSRRVRPVLMTAFTTIAGLLPLGLAESQGGASFISRPLAIASIGGLISATALTLIVVPVLYYSWNSMLERRQSKREASNTTPALIPTR